MNTASLVQEAIGRKVSYCEIESDYLSRDRQYKNESVKQPERERVLTFIVNNHLSKHVVMMSNPGLHWAFEKMLIDSKPLARCVGVEKHWGVLEYASRFMPRRELAHSQTPLRKDEWETKQGTLFGFSSLSNGRRKHYAICVPVEDVAGSRICGDTKHWRRLFFKNSAIWIDTFSPIGKPCKVRLLRNISCLCDPKRASVPCVITFMHGRDDDEFSRFIRSTFPGDSPLEQRAKAIKLLIESSGRRSFDVKDSWTYKSANDDNCCTMGNVAGILRRVNK